MAIPESLVRRLVWLAPLAAGLAALALGQDANWDLRNYHFYVPFAFLHGRMDLDVAVAHVATYYNPMLHLPFYWAVVHLPPRAVGFLAGAATGGFWFVAMWRRFGNPLFPYFNDVFHSPWASGGSYRHDAFIPSGLDEWLLLPFRFAFDPLRVAEVPFRDLRLPLLYLLLAALAVAGLRHRLAARGAGQGEAGVGPLDDRIAYLAWFTAFAFVAWAALFGVSRYLVPLELLAPLLAWFVLTELRPSIRSRPWLLVAAAVVMLAAGQRADWGRRPWSDDYFGVVPPRVAALPPALVLMAGREPSGYMVPFMPASGRFLRIAGYFTGPSATPNATDLAMRDAIVAHRGPVFLLYRVYEGRVALPAARHYGLGVEPGSCQSLLPAIEPDRKHVFLLCRLRPL
jgi:hypothetical protein